LQPEGESIHNQRVDPLRELKGAGGIATKKVFSYRH